MPKKTTRKGGKRKSMATPGAGRRRACQDDMHRERGDMMREKYKYGDAIPERFRDRLFEWRGGGYDGCFWEMNQGIVDEDGHWRPIFSTGCCGIDDDDWYDRSISELKNELGYDVTDVDAQYQRARRDAIRKVFGEDWYEKDVVYDDDPEVKRLMEKEESRLKEFRERRDAYREELQRRLDSAFMDALEREREDERPSEIGLLDDEHIKETCRVFCGSYASHVGMMANCLDKMAEMGYDTWCTCSDCGEQFQCGDFETFGCSIDQNAYTGDGGIGVIMKRVLCDECRMASECPSCYELDCPNERRTDRDPWDMYEDLLSCLLFDWVGICWGCASGFESDVLNYWDEACNERRNTELGEKYYRLEERAKEEFGLEGHELYERMSGCVRGKIMINEIRNLLQEAAINHFGDRIVDEDWFERRMDTDLPGQMKLPGFE